ncbi:MAG: AraC family transcriptional regulator [Gammaproteobacteria bacterium]|nr:AraC family transcriptional regulator [Gammaproteobacteria bacterium]
MTEEQQAGNVVAMVRAEYLIQFANWLRGIGTPVDRELARARLPTLIEEMPDEYVSLDLAFRFLMNCVRAEGVDDLGFEAGWGVMIDDFDPIMRNALCLAPTVRARLECFIRFASLENNSLRCSLQPEGEMMRLCIHQYCPPGGDSRISEWPAIKAVIEICRGAMGPDWLPPEICLQSSIKLHPGAQDRLGDTRVLIGQPITSILVPARLLATPVTGFGGFTSDVETGLRSGRSLGVNGDGLVELLIQALSPYLVCGNPSIDLAAEIAGISVRSLQRRLHQFQTTYSELVDRIRFDRAARLLRDPDLKIMDVALAVGYDDASNFARAFRRIGGMSPREFRLQQ